MKRLSMRLQTVQKSKKKKLSNKIRIQRGVPQGCPLSMLLFVLSSIPLIEFIKYNKRIDGYTTKRNSKIKIQSCADDNTVLIKYPTEYAQVISTYIKDSKASGADSNQEKTNISIWSCSKRRKSGISR